MIMGDTKEIPLGKRTKKYRFLEMLPAILSYGTIIVVLVLSYLNPILASYLLLLAVFSLIVKAVGFGYHTIVGYRRMIMAQNLDWHNMVKDLKEPKVSLARLERDSSVFFGRTQHMNNLEKMIKNRDEFPDVDAIRHIVIITSYNEGYDIIDPTLQSLVDTDIDNKNLIVVMAYEERGGKSMEQTVDKLEKKYAHKFGEFYRFKHPKDLPGEVIGKGGNIVWAGKKITEVIKDRGDDLSDYIVTTLDCDNRPHHAYFDYVSYEYIVHPERKNLSFQPIALFVNNIWDAPAPMRVLATGNSFWNVISSMRPYRLRNFASHAQPLDALEEMDFWSKRTIVEDGHQYWRSYFHFRGNYNVVPIHVPIYQDAVMSDTFIKTCIVQFKQIRRWSYGASDVAYVGAQIFTRKNKALNTDSFLKFWELLDGHVSQAAMPILVAIGGWLPLLISPDSSRSFAAHQLPTVVSYLMNIAMVGIFISIWFSFKLLPPRPPRYKKSKNLLMIIQWVLIPVTSIIYNSVASFTAQTYLLLGKYLDKFDVTDKVAVNHIIEKKEKNSK